jgi:hypothetical protein
VRVSTEQHTGRVKKGQQFSYKTVFWNIKVYSKVQPYNQILQCAQSDSVSETLAPEENTFGETTKE